MTKINLNRQFETSRYLNTQAGQELQDALTYLSQFAEITLRALRGGVGSLTYLDNFDCQTKTVGLMTGVEQIILLQPTRRISEVRLRQAVDQTYYVIESFGWKYDNTGNVVVKANFAGPPPALTTINVELLILFG